MGPVFPEVESVEETSTGTSDGVWFGLMGFGLTLEVYRSVVSSEDDVPWDVVCARGESFVKAEKVDVVTSVCVV